MKIDSSELDRYITGNYGEDAVAGLREPFEQIKAGLQAVGFHDYHVTGPGAGIDEAIAARSHCGECGHQGQKFHGFSDGRRYLAFAVCPVCGNWEEF